MAGLMEMLPNAASLAQVAGGILATMLAYGVALRLGKLTRQHPLANPILIAALLLIAGLALARLPVRGYMSSVEPLRWLLGPATVAFGLPIYRQRALIISAGKALIGAILIGSLAGIVSAVGLAKLLDLSPVTIRALSAKSITSPFAIAVMERLGGPAELAAGLVIVTGLLGAILLPVLLKRERERDPESYALALGLSAHIVGSQHVARIAPQALSIASLALTLAGLATTLLLPLLWPWIAG
ncbi:LrgB family protein [Pedomonas mirosovicensis]|uniref:LrgB family protein n=1 Tax=Pedomonas mirosovicensis TaxID=2908641 RepID=UPI0021697752|nr:LrgB family protein [Pedomonas mirosovicensis]MCH8683848.1 LrgB family protein [Pedomonas mirosovicensis]